MVAISALGAPVSPRLPSRRPCRADQGDLYALCAADVAVRPLTADERAALS